MSRYESADIPNPTVGKWAQRYATRSSDRDDLWHGALPRDEVRRARQAYYGSVSFVDEQIGRVLEALEQRGMLQDTLIVFIADHGDMLGDQNLWRKTYAYEPSARIPMLVRWPDGLLSGKRGQVRPEPVELRDILPTLLDACDSPPNRKMDGRSVLSLLKGEGKEWRGWIDLEHNICYSPENHWNALTDGEWKYIFHAKDGEEQLFHLHTDPHELNDLCSDPHYEETVRLWRQRLINHLSERGEPFVKNGRLGLRPEGMMLSPHFPGYGAYGPPPRFYPRLSGAHAS